MKIDKNLYLQVKKDCVDEQRIFSRYEIMRRYGVNEAEARAIKTLLENEELIFQDIITEIKTETTILKIGVCGDIHIGNRECREKEYQDYLRRLNDEGVKYLFIAGDLLDGIKVYKGQEFELSIIRVEDQIDRARELLDIFQGEVYYLIGNHEARITELTGLDVGNIIKNNKIKYIGQHRARVKIDGIVFEFWHGASSKAYALSYKLQKAIEQYIPGNKPRFLFAGHWHEAIYLPSYRNIDAFQVGCFEGETAFTKRLGVHPNIGGWIIEIEHSSGEVKSVEARYIHYYFKKTFSFLKAEEEVE